MPESAIAQPGDEAASAPGWYPFADLAGPLERLAAQCAGVQEDVQRAIREGAATLDALIAETEQGFERLRQAHAIVRELNDEQAAKVLRGVRERAGRRPVGFDLSGPRRRGGA